MPFCPKCRYEYNPGTETCPDCNEKLLENLPENKPEENEGKADSESDGERVWPSGEAEWVLLCTTGNIFYFQVLEQALKENGIACFFEQQPTRGSLGFGAGGPIIVYVPRDRLEEAKNIKEQTADNS